MFDSEAKSRIANSEAMLIAIISKLGNIYESIGVLTFMTIAIIAILFIHRTFQNSSYKELSTKLNAIEIKLEKLQSGN